MIVDVSLGDRSYPIHIGHRAWESLSDWLRRTPPTGVVIVTDDRVHDLYATDVVKTLEASGYDPLVFSVPEGEGSKSFPQVQRLCSFLAGHGLDRGCLLLGLGGGVVGDLTGFAASIYLRGVRFLQLPTTLLAMVDSSVGGKTGINIAEGKNLVGTFYQPEAVFAHTGALTTLDEREWYSGVAEVVKMALTLDKDFFEDLETLPDLSSRGGMDVGVVVARSCRLKARVVEADERETGLRMALNFGHTLAHALEAAAGYGTIRHGEAVVQGMKAAAGLSTRLCGLPEASYQRILDVLDRIPVPDVPVDGELTAYMARDKKVRDRAVQSVLLQEIGRHAIVTLEDPADLIRAFPAVR